MSVINGTSLLMYVDGTASTNVTGYSTNHSLNITMSPREVSSKTSGNYVSRESGRLDVNGSAEGMAVYNDDYGYEKMLQLVNNRTEVIMMFGNETSTSDDALDTTQFYASGSFLLTSVDIAAGDQENATYNVTFDLSGDFSLENQI